MKSILAEGNWISPQGYYVYLLSMAVSTIEKSSSKAYSRVSITSLLLYSCPMACYSYVVVIGAILARGQDLAPRPKTIGLGSYVKEGGNNLVP